MITMMIVLSRKGEDKKKIHVDVSLELWQWFSERIHEFIVPSAHAEWQSQAIVEETNEP